jgi:hypothetical protein
MKLTKQIFNIKINVEALKMKQGFKFTNPIVLSICSILIIVITALFLRTVFSTKTIQTQANAEVYEIVKNENPVDIENILYENTNTKIEEEMVLEEIDLEYTTQYRNNSELPTGTIQVVQEGRDGKQNAVIIKKYEDGELISEELVAENLIKASINKIVEVGTGSGTNNYKPQVRRYCICYFKPFNRKA